MACSYYLIRLLVQCEFPEIVSSFKVAKTWPSREEAISKLDFIRCEVIPGFLNICPENKLTFKLTARSFSPYEDEADNYPELDISGSGMTSKQVLTLLETICMELQEHTC